MEATALCQVLAGCLSNDQATVKEAERILKQVRRHRRGDG
jgi:hypothetical protein